MTALRRRGGDASLSRPRAPGSRGGLPWLFVAALAACGAPADTEPEVPPSAGDEREAGEGEEDLRALPTRATFADVVRAAQRLDALRDTESDVGCLIRTSPPRLEADLALAVREVPEPTEDLDARFDGRTSRVNVLSRWGAYGPGDPALPSFAAITTTLPPRLEPATVWVVTDQGVYVRSTAVEASGGGLAPPTVPDDAAALFIAAEPGVSLGRLAEVLAAAPERLVGRVALALALAPDTRLPAPPAPPEAPELDPFCPDGLPPLAEDAPLASPEPSALVARLGPLREGAAICVGSARGAGAGGGSVALAMRIAPDGHVAEACVQADATDDPSLRACLVRAAERTGFDPARPPGYVDLNLPLVLAPLASQRQRGVCD